MSAPTVESGKVVFLQYTLTNNAGEVLDKSAAGDPLFYLHGHGNIVPGLENALTGQAVGAELSVSVSPEEGYGPRDDKGVQEVPRAAFGDIAVQEGMQLFAQDDHGHPMPFWVQKVGAEVITVDFNHPLAGETLNFAVKVEKLRDATADELAHGHPHGPTGHEGHHHH